MVPQTEIFCGISVLLWNLSLPCKTHELDFYWAIPFKLYSCTLYMHGTPMDEQQGISIIIITVVSGLDFLLRSKTFERVPT